VGELIEFRGRNGETHRVDGDLVDRFVSGRTGKPISDAEWDEQKARLEADNDDLIPEEHRE